MQLKHLKIKNFGSLKDVDLDFTRIPRGVIAVMGNNGEGKSLFFEVMFCCLYGYMPMRRFKLQDLISGSNCYFSLEFRFGDNEYQSVFVIKENDVVATLSKNGQALNDGKITTFREVSSYEFVSPDIYLTTAYTTQGGDENFLNLSRADKKKLFIKMLGIEDLENKSVTSSLASKYYLDESSKIDYFLSEVGTVLFDDAIKETKEKISQNKDIVTKLIQEQCELETKEKNLSFEVMKLEEEVKKYDEEGLIASIEKLKSRSSELDSLINFYTDFKLDDVKAKLEEHRCIVNEISLLREARTTTANKLKDCKSKLSSLDIRDIKTIENEISRIKTAKEKLDSINCNRTDCFLLNNAKEGIDNLVKLEKQLKDKKKEEKEYNKILAEIEENDKALNDIDNQISIKTDYAEAINKEELMVSLNMYESVNEEKTRLEIDECNENIKKLEGEVAKIQSGDSKVKIGELKKELVDVRGILNEKVEEIKKVEAENAKSELVIEGYIANRKKRDDLMTKKKVLDLHASEWGTLSRILGKNGLQAIEIEQSQPMVTDIANQLLGSCFDNRYTLKLYVERKNKTEDFDVQVFDGLRPSLKITDSDVFSGGQQSIVSEALALAISLYNAKRHNVFVKTLFRDEVTSSLRSDNAVKYVEMLKKVLDIGGFNHILYISHSDEAIERGHYKLEVKNGEINLL